MHFKLITRSFHTVELALEPFLVENLLHWLTQGDSDYVEQRAQVLKLLLELSKVRSLIRVGLDVG